MSDGNRPCGDPPLPFNQAAVKQSTAPALHGPDASRPFFTVRFAMPIPPENDEQVTGPLVGIDPGVHDYHQSPGFEVMPNGDVLAIPYSGLAHREGGKYVQLVQARLRYGAEEFDMPEEVCVQGVRMSDLRTADGKPTLHGPPLLWREGDAVWLFTGFHWGWGEDHPYRFRVFRSTDNGATWSIVALEPGFSSADSDPQPITSAFRAPNGDMFVACDGKLGAGTSLLWRSSDNGLTWTDQGGRTSGRHSTIVPLDNDGTLLSLGGKDTNLDSNGAVFKDSLKNGYMPQNISTDWGRTWGAPTQSPFPWCGANQRPCAIRLAGGNLVMVGDSRHARTPDVPSGWAHGDGPYVALSTDSGRSWTIKALPVALRHVRAAHRTVGYSTVRQAPNGVIHLLTTRTHPMLHYEFNEAWITDPSAGDIAPETTGGTVHSFSETYPGGAPRATWSARRTPNGRYLLEGLETDWYENGMKQREVTWAGGRRTGAETFRGPEGVTVWNWDHVPARNLSVWTHWWPNGRKRLESRWDTNPAARDLPSRHFRGLVANGTARHWNESGQEVGAYTFLNGVRISPCGNHTETFATSPGGWTGSGNAEGGNDFGWSPTTGWCENNNAPYYGSKGEAGGVFARSAGYRWYADTGIDPKNRTQALHLAGDLKLSDTSFAGAFRIGYFSTSEPGSCFLGIEIREPAGVVLDPAIQDSGRLFKAYLSVKGTTGLTTISPAPTEPHMVNSGTFDLMWKGKPDGSGTLSGTLTGLPVSITAPAGSGRFDAFGILAGGDGGDDPTKTTGGCWFDNLTYDKGALTESDVARHSERTPATARFLRIMPMGDSITAGCGSFPGAQGGWRAPLHTLLTHSGCTFDFVGARTTDGDTCPDPHHWGQGGWQISGTPVTIEGRSYVSIQGQNRSGLFEEISDAISPAYFSTDSANTHNIILLQIGINDVLHQVVDGAYGSFDTDAGNDGQGEGQEWVAEGMIARLQALLRLIDRTAASRNLTIEVILGTLCPLTEAWTKDPVSDVLINGAVQYNDFIVSRVPSMVFSNISVKVVDHYSATIGKLADGLHPDSAGFAAMARVWFSAVSATAPAPASSAATRTEPPGARGTTK